MHGGFIILARRWGILWMGWGFPPCRSVLPWWCNHICPNQWTVFHVVKEIDHHQEEDELHHWHHWPHNARDQQGLKKVIQKDIMARCAMDDGGQRGVAKQIGDYNAELGSSSGALAWRWVWKARPGILGVQWPLSVVSDPTALELELQRVHAAPLLHVVFL